MSVDLIVEGTRGNIHGVLRCGSLTLPCSLGRSGILRDKHEGDGATPTGTFGLRRLLYRPDRVQSPKTNLPLNDLTSDDGWCDAPDDPHYNAQVKLPYSASHEELWREDGLYDLIVVIGYNDAPAVPGLGGAIFLHVRAPDGGATAGCVAVSREHLLALLTVLDAGSRIIINAIPA